MSEFLHSSTGVNYADESVDYNNLEDAPYDIERGGKALVASEFAATSEAIVGPESTTSVAVADPELATLFDELAANPIFVEMPPDIQQICLREHEEFDNCNNSGYNGTYIVCAYNLFANNAFYRDPNNLNCDTKDLPEILRNRRFRQRDEVTGEPQNFFNDERGKLQRYGIMKQLESAVKLSESIRAVEREQGTPPTIYALRGVPGSGKTTACRGARIPGIIIENGQPVGTIATDTSKWFLYLAGGSCDAIHAESAAMNAELEKLLREMVEARGNDFSEVRDRVFADPGDIDKLIKNAAETDRQVNILDIDVPYVVSAVRVLLRPKGSPEPHPGSRYMEKTFRKIRETRTAAQDESILCDDGNAEHTGQLIKAANEQGIGVNYTLLCYDYESDPKVIQREAAHLERDSETGKTHLVITDQRLFNRATDPEATEEEIAKVRDQVITQQFVDWYCDTFFDKDPASEKYIQEVRDGLAEYVERGLTIYQALDDKNL